jgi:hypothetical protein
MFHLSIGQLFSCSALLVLSLLGRSGFSQDSFAIKYGEPIGVLFPKTGAVFVIQSIADPLKVSSKAYFVVYKVESLKKLTSFLQAQEKSGINQPAETENLKERQFVVHNQGLNTKDSTLITYDELSFDWWPGNEKVCWIMGVKSEALIRPLFDFPPLGFEFEVSDFMTIKAYISNEQEKLIKGSVRTMGLPR